MERRQFTREFKLEAVRLIKQRGVSYAQASKDLGVHPTQLRNWVKQLADDPQHAFPGHGQMKPEQLEIAQPPRANAIWNTCLGQFRVQVGHEHDLIAEVFFERIDWVFRRGRRGRSPQGDWRDGLAGSGAS